SGSHPSFYTGQTPCGLAVLDVDADGLLDIAVANRDTQGLGLFLGDGSGGLRAGGILSMGSLPQSLAASRAPSSESALRLVILNAMSNSLSAVVQVEGKLCSLPEVYCGSEPHAPSLAELDGKPGLDAILLGAGPRGAELRMLHGDPDGHFSSASTLELGGSASDLVLLDLDRDGKSELAICDPNQALVVLMENEAARGGASALDRAARLPVPGLPLAFSAIEIDGDAAPELACVLGAPGERVGVAWLDARRDPNGELRLIELGFTPVPGAPIDAVACDLNGDGRMDLAVLANRAPDSGLGAWHGLMHGPRGPVDFQVSEPIATDMRPHAIAAVDVDGDRCAEVFVTVENSTLVQIWTPLPSSSDSPFCARALDSLGVGRGPFDLCLSDVDGDGLLDLCTANAFSNDLSVLYGTRR
ncbi:MAG: VCBS repeat-containing protein, partial [Planctomycetota bacterium]